MTASIVGVSAMKFPVSNLEKSREWYERVLGFEAELEFPDEAGVVRGVAGRCGGAGLALREAPEVAAAVSGFSLGNFAVADRQAIEDWAERLDGLGIEHSPVIQATIGWLLIFHDPDGLELHLYSQEAHGQDMTGRPGVGRPVQ